MPRYSTIRLKASGRSSARAANKHKAARKESSLTGIKVLLVDDDPDSRELMAEVLRSRGASVWVAESAPFARKLLGERNFEILISDLQMPGESGLTLIRRLRVQGVTVPAIALTGYDDARRRLVALAAGYNLYLLKPIEPSELVLSVLSLTARHPAGPSKATSQVSAPQAASQPKEESDEPDHRRLHHGRRAGLDALSARPRR